ncbi:hypothetical protein HY468_00360 [Candidatus Roizmanbacteria bacterium]|nr:hypothetical protein [Candidatus Roizmanbacteria bacterium]
MGITQTEQIEKNSPRINKLLYVAGIIVAGILVIIIIFLLYSRFVPSSSPTILPTPTPIISPSAPVSLTAPTTFFQSYTLDTSLPQITTLQEYQLHSDFSEMEIQHLTTIFGLSDINIEADWVVAGNTTDPQQRGLLTFNRTTGEFHFESYGIHLLPSSSTAQSVNASVHELLTNLGIADDTITCPFTYERTSIPEVLFVECHRDWEQMGAPILNPIGMVNLPETIPFSQLRVGYTFEGAPTDEDVVNTSSKQDGLARPNDFNTATVALYKQDNSILAIDSTIRPIERTLTTQGSTMMNPDEALASFQNHQATFSLTIPAGSGYTDLANVYPNNQATGKVATITDFILTYEENLPGTPQASLSPVYLIRGTAELDSGYRVRFVETIPATKQTAKVQGERTYLAQDSIKLGNLTPGPSQTPTVPIPSKTPKAPPITPTSFLPTAPLHTPRGSPTPPPTVEDCADLDTGKLQSGYNIYTIDIPGKGTITLMKGPISGFYFKEASFQARNIGEIRKIVIDLVVDQLQIYVAGYLKDHPDELAEIKTSEDKKKLLGKIGETVDTKTYVYSGISPLRDKAEERLVAMVTESTIDEWATKDDIFPRMFFYSGYSNLDETHFCFITGHSPALFFYTDKPMRVSVQLGFDPLYADPVTSDWLNIRVFPDGTLLVPSSTSKLTKLYYEFDRQKTTFHHTNEGFIVRRDTWESLVTGTIALSLRLTPDETRTLVTDVARVVRNMPDASHLRLSVVDQQQLNDQLPISINPKPSELHRVHILVSPLTNSMSISYPSLSPVSRTGFTVVEVGASPAL